MRIGGLAASLGLLASAGFSATLITKSFHDDTSSTVAPTLPGLTVDARATNPGNEGLARPQCVAFSVGAGFRYECGDLQARHVFPSTRVRNRTRTPMLLYNSATALPRPVVGAYVSTPAATTADSITASLVIGGNTVASTQYDGAAWGSGGVTRRVALKFDGSSYATGLYAYTFNISAKISGQYHTASDTGSLVIVNRSSSKYGAGWWLASHERLYQVSSTRVLWVGGDGSWLLYAGSSGTFYSTGATGLDTSGVCSGCYHGANSWYRSTREGGRVFFEGIGGVGTFGNIKDAREPNGGISTLYTVNDSGYVSQIRLPRPAPDSTAGAVLLTYDFTYGNSGVRLSQLASPGLTAAQSPKRTTSFTIGSDGRLTAITDPDALSTAFGYSASSNVLVTRTDKRSNVITTVYDSALSVARVERALNSADTAKTTFCSSRLYGLVSINCSAGPSDTATVATLVDGPRDSTDVFDRVKIWTTRAGGPLKVVGSVSDTTMLTYADGTFLGLVTKIRTPDGHEVQTWYNARALPDSTKDLSNCPSGTCATTRYEWDSKWPSPTKITQPMGEYTQSTYHSATGLREWQQDRSGTSSRTEFFYRADTLTSAFLVDSIVYPTGSGPTGRGRERLVYDLFSNAAIDSTPDNRVTTVYANLAGNVVKTVRMGPRGAIIDTTYYDAMDRPIKGRSKFDAGGGDSIVVSTTLDNEGNPTAVVRRASRMADSLKTQFAYDKANRKTLETAPDAAVDSVFYDKAGNVTRTRTRRGHSLTMVYDAANRLTSRVVPAVTYDSVMRGMAALTGFDTNNTGYPRYPNETGWKYKIPADTPTYTYDVAGRLLTANNRQARVTRTYTAWGALSTEQQKLRTWDGSVSDTAFAHHDYLLTWSYDRNGRVTALTHPTQLLPKDANRTIGGTTAYAYDTLTARLRRVTDVFGQRHDYTYSPRGDVTQRRHSMKGFYTGVDSAILDNRTFTLDGLVSTQSTSRPIGNSSIEALISGSMTWNAAGTTTDVTDGGAAGSSAVVRYGQMGTADTLVRSFIDLESENELFDCQINTHDALGNLLTMGRTSATNTPCDAPETFVQLFYGASSGRLLRTKLAQRVEMQSYDAAGNLEFAYADSFASSLFSQAIAERYTYYAADGKPAAADARNAVRYHYNGYHTLSDVKVAFEEYRYDGLGRRVVVRARKRCDSAASCALGTIRRTVWAGDQELHEITMPGHHGVAAAALENDTLPVTYTFASGAYQPSPLFGRVMYVFGTALDRPEAIIRSDYVKFYDFPDEEESPADSSCTFKPHTVLPVYDWRGQLQSALFAETGTITRTDANCPGSVTAPAGDPALAYGGLLASYDPVFGTLLGGKRDAAGTMFRRNRLYDPATGRFTQEDPSGLGGGVNLYGYAGGDPINSSDPLGLNVSRIEPDGGICGRNPTWCEDRSAPPDVPYSPSPGDSPGGGSGTPPNREDACIAARVNALMATVQDAVAVAGGFGIAYRGLKTGARVLSILDEFLTSLAPSPPRIPKFTGGMYGAGTFARRMNTAGRGWGLIGITAGISGTLDGISGEQWDSLRESLLGAIASNVPIVNMMNAWNHAKSVCAGTDGGRAP
jgi:RHS repeat-associated protein